MATYLPQINIEYVRRNDLLEVSPLVLKEESAARRKLTIPKEESLFLAQLPVVSFQRLLSLFYKFLELDFFGE